MGVEVLRVVLLRTIVEELRHDDNDDGGGWVMMGRSVVG